MSTHKTQAVELIDAVLAGKSGKEIASKLVEQQVVTLIESQQHKSTDWTGEWWDDIDWTQVEKDLSEDELEILSNYISGCKRDGNEDQDVLLQQAVDRAKWIKMDDSTLRDFKSYLSHLHGYK